MAADLQPIIDRAYALVEQGSPEEAVLLSAPLADAPEAGLGALAVHCTALKAAGRTEEALPYDRRAVAAFPDQRVAWHNLAATLEDLGEAHEAKAALDRAFALGLDAPETWIVLGHAHVKLAEYDAAEKAFREVLRRRPASVETALDLARLMWMTTGDWRAAAAPLRAVRAAGSDPYGPVLFEAKLLAVADQFDELTALFDRVLAQYPRDPILLRAGAHAALEAGDLARAGALAQKTLAIDPDYLPGLIEMATVRLAQGRGDDAFAAALRATKVAPLDQSTWGWLATAGRAIGHKAYEELCDYEAVVRPYRIEAPPGWADLDAFLADLSATLRDMHRLKIHPADQSLREGTQTVDDLSRSAHPVLRAFFAALDAPIRQYLADIGTGPGPLRSRNVGTYQFQSAWSVLLRPNGFHVDHYHPMGWISSAFYVETPQSALETDAREGWIKFGQPPYPTRPAQPPAWFVRPAPGTLVLFPSYMWHGTVPFTSAESRMTIAFDMTP